MRIWELSNTIGSTEGADGIPEDVQAEIVNRAWGTLHRFGIEQTAQSWDDAVRLANQI
jgi:hypothetical protein